MALKVSINTPYQPAEEPKEALVFSAATAKKIENIVKRYPQGRQQSALIPVLFLAQNEFGGWLSTAAMELVAQTLGLSYMRVYEVATFYTMFNLQPVGKYHVQVCTNCACLIRGSDKITTAVKKVAGVKNSGETSTDGTFTFSEVECLGACVDAPMMQINNDYFTNLTAESTQEILKNLKAGKPVKPDTAATEIDPISYNAALANKPVKKAAVKKAPTKKAAPKPKEKK